MLPRHPASELTLPTRALAIAGPAPDELAHALRLADPPVVTRVDDDQVVLDPRTVLPGEDDALLAALELQLGTGGT